MLLSSTKNKSAGFPDTVGGEAHYEIEVHVYVGGEAKSFLWLSDV